MKIVFSKEADSEWNNRLMSTDMGNIYQTTHYAKYLQEVLKEKPMYVTISDGKDILAQVLIFKKKQTTPFLKWVQQKTYHWIYGPVIFNGKEEEVYTEFIKKMIKKAKSEKCTISKSSFHPLSQYKKELSIKGLCFQEHGTVILDLRKKESGLWKEVRRDAKRKVKKALKEEIKVEEVKHEKDFKRFYQIQCEGRRRNKLPVRSFEGVYQLWKILSDEKVMAGFITKKEDKLLSGILISTFNNYLNEWGLALSDFAIENKLPAGDLLNWYVIKWGSEQGVNYYDKTGVCPNPKTKKEKGIFDFKTKWGGEIITYNQISYDNNLWRQRFEILGRKVYKHKQLKNV